MVNRPTSGDLNPIFDADYSRRIGCYLFPIFLWFQRNVFKNRLKLFFFWSFATSSSTWIPMGSQGMDPWGSWVPMGSQGMEPRGSWVPNRIPRGSPWDPGCRWGSRVRIPGDPGSRWGPSVRVPWDPGPLGWVAGCVAASGGDPPRRKRKGKRKRKRKRKRKSKRNRNKIRKRR